MKNGIDAEELILWLIVAALAMIVLYYLLQALQAGQNLFQGIQTGFANAVGAVQNGFSSFVSLGTDAAQAGAAGAQDAAAGASTVATAIPSGATVVGSEFGNAVNALFN